jgi:hypothetical protein
MDEIIILLIQCIRSIAVLNLFYDSATILELQIQVLCILKINKSILY